MKKAILFLLVFVTLFLSGQAQEKKETNNKKKQTTKNAKTYAEISIKEGGKWEDRKYVGGEKFVNVESLKIPKQHTDHSFYIRYEGPGWENNKIGYRLYTDWRNAIDIFGKVTDSLILNKVGQDGFDSYHEKNSWGQDILKVGKGLGIGSIGRYVDKKVMHFENVDSTFVKIENTNQYSSVKINYFGWNVLENKTDLSSLLTIKPNERYTKHTIKSSVTTEGICTGIVNHGFELIQKQSANKKWAYIATYGIQTLVPDKLGMAIFYKTSDITSVVDSEFDYLLVFKPKTEEISFYFLGAWEQEPNGIKTQEEFILYLDKKLAELNKKGKL